MPSLSWRAGSGEEMLHAEDHSPCPLYPTAVSHCPLPQQSPAHGLSRAWGTPLLLRGAGLHSEPQNKAFLSQKEKKQGGEKQKERQEGKGDKREGAAVGCSPSPA